MRVGVVGATGLVGTEMLRVLEERAFPVDEPRVYASPRSEGRRLAFAGREGVCETLRDGCFDGLDLVEPGQFRLELLDDQSEHPDCFMVGMADFAQDGLQSGLLTLQLRRQEFSAPLNLLSDHPRPRLPRKRHPGEKPRTFALRGPVFTLQRAGQGRATARCHGENATVRTCGGLGVLTGAEQAESFQLFQRIVNLRTRNPRPVAHLAALQL